MEGRLIAGLEKLRGGALLSMISTALAAAALGVILCVASSIGPGRPWLEAVALHEVAAASAALIMALASLVLAVAAFVYWFMASGDLKRHSPRLGIGRTGMVLSLVGVALLLLVLVAGAAALAPSLPRQPADLEAVARVAVAMVAGALASAAIVVVGGVLFGVMIIRLADEPGVQRGFAKAGVLFIVGLVLSALLTPLGLPAGAAVHFAACALIYHYSGGSLRGLRASAPSPAPPGPP
ncbi:MAG: DUF973 family protein [Candidatus Nezhaarchaeales archaeon]